MLQTAWDHGTTGWDVFTEGKIGMGPWARGRERHSGYIGENRREEGEERSEYDVKTPLPVFA